MKVLLPLCFAACLFTPLLPQTVDVDVLKEEALEAANGSINYYLDYVNSQNKSLIISAVASASRANTLFGILGNLSVDFGDSASFASVHGDLDRLSGELALHFYYDNNPSQETLMGFYTYLAILREKIKKFGI